jgi:hypothetical protein
MDKSTEQILDLLKFLNDKKCLNKISNKDYAQVVDRMFSIKQATLYECRDNLHRIIESII